MKLYVNRISIGEYNKITCNLNQCDQPELTLIVHNIIQDDGYLLYLHVITITQVPRVQVMRLMCAIHLPILVFIRTLPQHYSTILV